MVASPRMLQAEKVPGKHCREAWHGNSLLQAGIHFPAEVQRFHCYSQRMQGRL